MKSGTNILLAGLLMLFLWSCDKDNTFPAQPYMEFRSVEFFESSAGVDSIYIQYYFRDGDGDIGSRVNETGQGSECTQFDLTGVYEEFQDGVWVVIEEQPELGQCFNSLTPEGQDKTLEGDIYIKQIPGAANPSSIHSDSVRFQYFLHDRAGNSSDGVYTDLIVY